MSCCLSSTLSPPKKTHKQLLNPYSYMNTRDILRLLLLGVVRVTAIESERLEEDWETTGKQRIEFWQEVSRQARDKNVKLPAEVVAAVEKDV